MSMCHGMMPKRIAVGRAGGCRRKPSGSMRRALGAPQARYGDLDEIAWYADNSGRQHLDSTWIWKEDEHNYIEALERKRQRHARSRPEASQRIRAVRHAGERVGVGERLVRREVLPEQPVSGPLGPSPPASSSHRRAVARSAWWFLGATFPGTSACRAEATTIRPTGATTSGFVVSGKWIFLDLFPFPSTCFCAGFRG